MKRILLMALCAGAIASPALAQYNAPRTATTAARTPTTPDGAFVAAAAQSAFYGAALGRLAETRAAGADVKRMAREMIAMAERMTADVGPMLKTQGVDAPADMTQRQKSVYEWLGKLSGEEFDRAFVSSMRATRASDVMVFQRASDKAHDGELRAWAGRTLPSLKTQQEAFNEMK